MTDEIMIKECLLDPDLTSYSVIILEDAHERTIHTDMLFPLCKFAAYKRDDLKIIVTGATIECFRFSQFFDSAPKIFVTVPNFLVETLHTREPVSDYLGKQ